MSRCWTSDHAGAHRAVGPKCARLLTVPNQPGLTISYIKCRVSSLAKKYGAKKVSLIGSFARGEERPDSDVDILLEKGKIRGMQVLEFQDALEQELNRKVDIISTAGASPRFLERVKKRCNRFI